MPDARPARYLQTGEILPYSSGSDPSEYRGEMATNATFARLAARPVDRTHIAASIVPTRDELFGIEGFNVSPGNAALVASILSRDGMTWDQLRVPLRYQAEVRVRARLDECVRTGVITFDDDELAYTSGGRAAAQAVFDAHAVAIQDKWSNTATQVEQLLALVTPVADAATAAGSESSQLVDRTLAATQPNPASELWRALAKIRRFRADCHAQAWSEAGHTIESIVALPADAPDRIPIEDRTDELNGEIWSLLAEDDQLHVMACLASLDGSGTPT